jgi:hypothetical protein
MTKIALVWLLCTFIHTSNGFVVHPCCHIPVLSRQDPQPYMPITSKKSGEDGSETHDTVLNRFTSPMIDDPYLPLADVSVAQVVAPSLQVLWLAVNHSPSPTWLRPIFDSHRLFATRGSLVAPTLIHGAALASCWIAGALAAKAYERDAIVPFLHQSADGDPTSSRLDYSRVVIRIVQSGAFGTGILVFCTQLDLFAEFGFRYVQLGEGDATDFRILTAIVEVVNDVFFEALSLIGWRLFVAFQSRRGAS